MKSVKEVVKFAITWTICLLIRFIPGRAPNFEPVISAQMPLAKKFGAWGGFVFGFLSIALFDLIDNKFGSWTLITGLVYGLLGVGAYYFLKTRKNTALNYIGYGILGTLIYDALTGLTIGPLFWGQSFSAAFFGQIPFTLNHLAGTIIFSFVLSPRIYTWIATNEKLELGSIFQKLGWAKA